MKKSGLTKIIYNVAMNVIKDSKVTIIELNSDAVDSDYKKSLTKLGVNFINAELSRINFIRNVFTIKKLLSGVCPDIVHAHCLRSIVFLSFVNEVKYKKTCTMHSYIVSNYEGEFGRIKGRFLADLVINRIRKYDAIISVSESVQKLFKDKEKVNTVAICNGVDRKDRVIQAYEKSSMVNFVYTGSISHRKRIKFLCESILRYNRKSPVKIILTLAGSGPFLDELSSKYIQCDSLHFLGNVDDVDNCLSTASYFISASASEGLPNAVMEAMALGLPVILSDIPPHMELLNDGKIGYSFELDVYDSLKKSLDKVVCLDGDDYLSLSTTAHCKINNKYNVKHMACQHIELYEKLIN